MDDTALIAMFGLEQGGALQDVRLPKARFLQYPDSTAADRRLITDDIGDMSLLAVFNTDTTNIPSVRTDETVYEEIYFIRVALKRDTHLATLDALLQRYITNPAVLFYVFGNRVAISAAPKRISKNESTSTVIEQRYFTEWLDPEHPSHARFLEAGAVTKCSFLSLERLYRDFAAYVHDAALLPFATDLAVDRRRQWQELDPLIERHRALSSRLRAHQDEERSHTSFGQKLAFRSKQVETQAEMDHIAARIKAILGAS